MKTIENIQQIVSRLAKQYGAERVYLFGYSARGDATEHSDIDLRIDKGEIRGLRFASLLGDLQKELGTKVDLISTNGMDEKFLDLIHPDEVLIYERS